jgi:hypothetical protein
MIKFLLRIDAATYEKLQAAASRSHRSVNGLINYLIEEYLKKEGK